MLPQTKTNLVNIEVAEQDIKMSIQDSCGGNCMRRIVNIIMDMRQLSLHYSSTCTSCSAFIRSQGCLAMHPRN